MLSKNTHFTTRVHTLSMRLSARRSSRLWAMTMLKRATTLSIRLWLTHSIVTQFVRWFCNKWKWIKSLRPDRKSNNSLRITWESLSVTITIELWSSRLEVTSLLFKSLPERTTSTPTKKTQSLASCSWTFNSETLTSRQRVTCCSLTSWINTIVSGIQLNVIRSVAECVARQCLGVRNQRKALTNASVITNRLTQSRVRLMETNHCSQSQLALNANLTKRPKRMKSHSWPWIPTSMRFSCTLSERLNWVNHELYDWKGFEWINFFFGFSLPLFYSSVEVSNLKNHRRFRSLFRLRVRWCLFFSLLSKSRLKEET